MINTSNLSAEPDQAHRPVQIPEPMGPSAAQIVSCVRDCVGSSAMRGQSVGSKGRSSCDAGAMATAPNYGDFALKRFLGLNIEQVASGRARAQITIADEHRNPNGVVHGAVYFAMVDTAMGAATMSLLSDGRFCTSVEVQLRFIRPADNGVLIADVSVVKMGRSVVHLEARVHDGDERLIATGGGTFAIIES
jgi:acyl-CoA thioesterase